MDISILIPMYNEEANAEQTIKQVEETMSSLKRPYEIVVINDGSKDNTLEIAKKIAKNNKKIIICNHIVNRGLGNSIKTGFKYSKGDIVVPVDADLSYNVKNIPVLIAELDKNPSLDIVTLSPYMKNGKAKGVPPFRLLLSKIGNKIISFAMSAKLHTVTCMVRAYRRKVIDSLDLDSEGPEIQVEILAKALDLGFKVKEIPAILTGRIRGKSKFQFSSGVSKHLIFSLYEKPMLLFGFVGLLFVLIGLSTGTYLFCLYLKSQLDPSRPLMNLTIVLILVGILLLFSGFISNQLVNLRREIYKVQKENLLFIKKTKSVHNKKQ